MIRDEIEEYFLPLTKPWKSLAIDIATGFAESLLELFVDYQEKSLSVERLISPYIAERDREQLIIDLEELHSQYLPYGDRAESFSRLVGGSPPDSSFGYSRAVMIAQTEVMFMMNYLDYLSYVSDPEVLFLTWQTVPDDGAVRSTHLVANGQTVFSGEPFVVGDSIMRFPTDGSLGASAREIVNCRCTLAGIKL